MASAIDSGVDTGNDSNDSCVQDRTSKMEVDQPQANTSSELKDDKNSSSNQDARDEQTEILKDLNGLILSKGDLPPRISLIHLQPTSLSHGYEVPALQRIGKFITAPGCLNPTPLEGTLIPSPLAICADEEYKNTNYIRKMKLLKCRLRTAPPIYTSRKKVIIKQLRDCHQLSLYGETDPVRMCRAACVNNVDAVREMLEAGMSPNCYDCFQRTPLHIASCMGYKELVELLLSHGANPNAKDRIGNTPLHLAACTNHIEVINLLLKAGTNVLEKDLAGHSPLHFAVTKFNIMSRSQSPVHKQQVCQVIAMLAEYMRLKDVANNVDNDLLMKFENLLRKSKSNEPVDSGVRDLLNNLSTLSISSNT